MRKYLLFVIIYLVLTPLVAQNCHVPSGSPLDRFLTSASVKDASVSLLICRQIAGRDTAVAEYRSTCPTPQASTMKILTTATAFLKYGPGYRYETTLAIDGFLDSLGTVHGNLYVQGVGDPSLGSRSDYTGEPSILSHWADTLQAMGIRKIEGSVIGDASWASPSACVNPYWLWQDIGNGYGTGSFGLCYRDNRMTINYFPGAEGNPIRVAGTTPALPQLTFVNNTICRAGAGGDVDVSGLPFSDVRYLYGTVSTGAGMRQTGAALPNPPLTLAEELDTLLRQRGVEIQGRPDYTLNLPRLLTVRSVIYTHRSDSLSVIIKHCNRHSDNMYAEQLFLLNGKRPGQQATISASIAAERAFWADKVSSIRRDYIMDGSGLSTHDALSARTLVSILQYMKTTTCYPQFHESLAISGTSGTFKHFLDGGRLHGVVYGKSGTTSHIKAFAGYATVDNRDYTFAVIVNNQQGSVSQVKEEIEKLLLDYLK